PLVGRVDTSVEECFEDFARVAPGWIPLVEKSTKVVAALLAKQLLGTASILDARIARLLTTVAAELRDEIRDQVRFPTLQAGEAKLDELRRADGLVYTSSRRYPSWRSGSSELDKPVLFVPQGSPLERLLPSLQVGLRDVTDAVAQLQERRGRAGEVPRLAGQAAHPALRAPIEDPVLRGEIELCEIASEVTLVDVVGYSHTLDGPFLCPVRAVIQADELFSAALATRAAARIADATFELLPKLAEQLDVLPDFVRDAVRALLRSRAVSGVEPSRPVKAARVLPDIDGRWYSLLELEAHEAVPFTTSEPPFPKRSEPVLRLALNEIAPLERVLRLADITNELEREAEAERRRQTPPRASIELPLELKARCLWTQRFEADGMRGEIGIMTPQQAKHGIDLSTGGRPLCRLDEAWPLCAAVDAPVEANRFFDGVENDDEARKVVSRLRAFAETLLRKHLAPPADALAAVWIDIVVPDEIHVIGTLWLPRAWPRRRPQVRVRASTLASEHADVALRRLFGSEHIEHLIPVDGNLLVRAEDSSDLHQPLVNLALEHAEALLAAARQNAAADARELERFHWNLFLIGAAMPEAPVAMVADGRRIDGHDLVAELEQRGELWLTRRRGSIEGSFPSREPPAFVLLDDQPLIDVLRARLTHSILRELGGETDREDDPDAVEIVP
ncbi:MAG TPA: hypothetical protein VFB62_10440, partial [Polyangiaceae bacterium]|nr:hypothetical protein [Polyangiaceae bacterium]